MREINQKILKNFYSRLDYDKIKINWNKNPIQMDKFLSFLTVPVEIIRDHLGSDTGWTKKENKEHKLIVGGGYVNGVEWLDSIQYGTKLSNPYNNYVNPFFCLDILTQEGVDFFLGYYKSDIEKIIEQAEEEIIFHSESLKDAHDFKNDLLQEIEFITNPQS